jgi:hypothetical protein
MTKHAFPNLRISPLKRSIRLPMILRLSFKYASILWLKCPCLWGKYRSVGSTLKYLLNTLYTKPLSRANMLRNQIPLSYSSFSHTLKNSKVLFMKIPLLYTQIPEYLPVNACSPTQYPSYPFVPDYQIYQF